MNEFLFYVIDNDSKKDARTGCGTIFEAKVTIDGVVYYGQWSIMDEVNNTNVYKCIQHLKQCVSVKAEANNNRLNDATKKAKVDALNNEVNSYKFSENELNIIKKVLTESKNDVECYIKKGNEKAINPIMGKLLKQLNVKPYVLKCKILDLIKE